MRCAAPAITPTLMRSTRSSCPGSSASVVSMAAPPRPFTPAIPAGSRRWLGRTSRTLRRRRAGRHDPALALNPPAARHLPGRAWALPALHAPHHTRQALGGRSHHAGGAGGSDDPANLQVLCAPCHGTKTAKRDAPQLAKAKRIQARHVGAWRPAEPMRGSRASPWKRRLDGSVVRRQLIGKHAKRVNMGGDEENKTE